MELKIGLRSFNTFYLEFVKFASKPEFTKKMLLQELIYNLFFYIENKINSELEDSNNINNLDIY